METNTNAIEFENKTLRERALSAAVRFLKRRECEIVDREWYCNAGSIDIVARQNDTLVFTTVTVREADKGPLPEDDLAPETRSRREQLAAAFLMASDLIDTQIRFDNVSLLVFGGNRALVCHRINALG